jgi:FlaA1/EpsC-like NDP-sugar epimerase
MANRVASKYSTRSPLVYLNLAWTINLRRHQTQSITVLIEKQNIRASLASIFLTFTNLKTHQADVLQSSQANNTAMSKAILVTGATGKQGGSVITNLLKQDADVEILAVTRDVNSASATKLAAKSPKIKLVQGNLDQVGEIFANAKKATTKPIWGVYSVQVCALHSF